MVIIGLRHIGDIFGGKSRQTIARWIKHHGLRARRLPDGRWITSLSLIEQWIDDGHKSDPLVQDNRTITRRRKRPKSNS